MHASSSVQFAVSGLDLEIMEIEKKRKCWPGLVMVILIRSHISSCMTNRIAYTMQCKCKHKLKKKNNNLRANSYLGLYRSREW